MANKANKAKGRIVKAVNKVLSTPRPEGPAPRKRVTLYTPEAAKKAGKRYRAAVQEGIDAGDKELTTTRVNPYSRTGTEETQGTAMLKGNPFAKTSRATKEGQKQKARNARVGTAKPHGIKRISQTGTEVGTRARISKPQIEGTQAERVALTETLGEIEGGRNHPMFDPANADKYFTSDTHSDRAAKISATKSQKRGDRGANAAAKPAARPAPKKTIVQVPTGKRMAYNVTTGTHRFEDAKPAKRGGGVPWLGVMGEPKPQTEDDE